MCLSEFIVHNVDRIVDEWEQFAETITPAAESMNSLALRDHAKEILLAASRDMNTAQTASEQQAVATDQINRTIGDVTSLSRQTAVAMSAASRAVAGLSAQVQNLEGLIEQMQNC